MSEKKVEGFAAAADFSAAAAGIGATAAQDAEAPLRSARLRRRSRETDVLLELRLDGGTVSAATGIGFLDHLLESLAVHAGWGLEIRCAGDLQVDDHHSAEDCALTLGEALAISLARGPAPRRFGAAYAPMDEALARAVVDLSGRPFCRADLGLEEARLGALAGENAAHFLTSLATAAKITIHIDVLAGENSHHKAEAAFKALALALREACALRAAYPPREVPLAAAAGAAGAREAAGGTGALAASLSGQSAAGGPSATPGAYGPSGSPAAGGCPGPGACAGASAKGKVELEELDPTSFEALRAQADGRR